MKAAVLFKPNEPLQVVDCELDPPKAGEVRVKMKASGVCQSDWHVMNGDWPSPLPIVPGHEAAGEIAECGAGVTTVKPGDHVIFSFRPHCGRCRYCTQGRTVLCIGRASVPPGASKIIAADILDNKLEMAKTFGATHTINTGTNQDPVKKVKEITGGLGVDYSFDAVSIEKTQALAFDALAPGGHAVAVGISAATVRPDLDFPVLVDHYMNKRLNIDGLISRTYKLADINEGFRKMMAGEVARGVVVFD